MAAYESFVYEWTNIKNNKKYIGFHKGSIDDGYVCSSKYMMEDYKENPSYFTRKIVSFGIKEEMLKLETDLLVQIDAAKRLDYYNRSNGHNNYATILFGKDNPSFGKKWYTDGIKNIRLSPNDKIPERFYLGMSETTKKSHRENVLGVKVYTNGTINMYIKTGNVIPEGFILGKTKKNNKKLLQYNDGITEKRAFEGVILPKKYKKGRLIKSYTNGVNGITLKNTDKIPDGYYLGITEERRKKYSQSAKKRKPYTDGEKNIYVFDGEDIPEGFYFGRSKKTREKNGKATKGSKWYTNGEKNIRLFAKDIIPKGYHIGKIYSYKSIKKGKN